MLYLQLKLKYAHTCSQRVTDILLKMVLILSTFLIILLLVVISLKINH